MGMQILQVVETLLKQATLLQPSVPDQLPKSSPAALFLLELCAKAAACSKPGTILRYRPVQEGVSLLE